MRPLGQNPFDVGGWVRADRCVERASLVTTAFDMMLNHSHLAVRGASGVGKTSFLRYLEDAQVWGRKAQDRTSTVVAYLNCTTIDPFTPAAFWHELLSVLRERVEQDAALLAAVDRGLAQAVAGRAVLDQTLRSFGQHGKSVVFLLDEYDAALRPHDTYSVAEMSRFLSEYRNLAIGGDGGRHLATVVTTFHKLSDLGPPPTPGASPWYNHYFFATLKPFDEPELRALVTRLSEHPALTAEQHAALYEITAGHPALVQHACYLLWSGFASRKNTRFDTQAFLNDFLAATERFYLSAWESLTDTEQMLMMLIALSRLQGRLDNKRRYDLGDVKRLFSQYERELVDLEQVGLIRPAQGRDPYEIASTIMEWWVIKEIENSADEAELQRRERVFANLGREDVARLTAVLRFVWQNKDAAPAIAGWAGKVTGAFAKGFGGG